MADMEKFLLEKLDKAIEDAKDLGCSNSIFKECSGLKKLIEDKQKNTAVELSGWSKSILKECIKLKNLIEDKQQNIDAGLLLKECSKLKKLIEDKQHNELLLKECSKLKKLIEDRQHNELLLNECSKLKKLIEDKQQNTDAEPSGWSNSILKECSRLKTLIEDKQQNTDAELLLKECSKLKKLIEDKQQNTDAELSGWSNSILEGCSRLKKLIEDKQQNTDTELSGWSKSILKECSKLQKLIKDKQHNIDALKECSKLKKLIEDREHNTGCSNSILKECSKLKKLIEDKKQNTGAAVEATRRENLYYLNNVVAEWQAVLKKHNHYSPAAQITLNQLTESLKKIRKELETSKDKEKTDVEASRDEEKADKKHRGLKNPYHVDLLKIHGIKYKSEAMERLLVRKETESKGFRAIGVVGMTGVGKTTFCQVAFNNEEVKKHFFPRIWVEMSVQPEQEEDYKKEVAKSFLRSLGFEDKVIDKIGNFGPEDKNGSVEPSGLSLLLLALRKQLQGKRYLVVLDDIWHLDERFENFCSSLADDEEYNLKLAYGLPKGSGGTVIVTSRSEKWAVSMVGERNLQRLTPLEDEDIWSIYLETRRERGYAPEKGEEKTYDKIVKRCAGLPLIAKMLGETVVKKFEDAEKAKGKA